MSARPTKIIRVASIDFDGHFASSNQVQTHIHQMILALPEDAPGDPLKAYLKALIRHAVVKKIKSGLEEFEIILNGSARQTERWDLERLFANKNGLVIESLRKYARESGKSFHEVSSAGIKADGSIRKMGFSFEESEEAPFDLYKQTLVERQIRYIAAWAKATYPDGNYQIIYQFSDDFPKGTLRGLIHFLERNKALLSLIAEIRLTPCCSSFYLKPLLDFLTAEENKDLMEPLSPTSDELDFFASQPFKMLPYTLNGTRVESTDSKTAPSQFQFMNAAAQERLERLLDQKCLQLYELMKNDRFQNHLLTSYSEMITGKLIAESLKLYTLIDDVELKQDLAKRNAKKFLNKAQLQVLDGTPMEPAVICSECSIKYPQQDKGSSEERLKKLFDSLKPQAREVSAGAGIAVAIARTRLADMPKPRSSTGDKKRKRPEEAESSL